MAERRRGKWAPLNDAVDWLHQRVRPLRDLKTSDASLCIPAGATCVVTGLLRCQKEGEVMVTRDPLPPGADCLRRTITKVPVSYLELIDSPESEPVRIVIFRATLGHAEPFDVQVARSVWQRNELRWLRIEPAWPSWEAEHYSRNPIRMHPGGFATEAEALADLVDKQERDLQRLKSDQARDLEEAQCRLARAREACRAARRPRLVSGDSDSESKDPRAVTGGVV